MDSAVTPNIHKQGSLQEPLVDNDLGIGSSGVAQQREQRIVSGDAIGVPKNA